MEKRSLGIPILLLVLVVTIITGLATAQKVEAQQQTSIQILALRFGTLGYTGSFGLADLINKKSSWLKAAAVETKGTIVNARTLAEEAGKRKNTVILNDLTNQDLAENAKPPFTAPYHGLRAISLAYRVAGCFVTLDPKIKTGQDLIGKRVGIGLRGSTSALWPEIVLKYGWEVWDKLKSVQYLGYAGSYDALRAGTLDVALFNNTIPGIASPAAVEFMESVPAFYTISIPADIIRKARQKSGLPIFSASLPAHAVNPKQTEEYHGFSFVIGWWADKEMPDEIPYEICRVIYDNYKELWGYHKGLTGITPETMGLAAEAKDYHPGAVKFYKEKSIKIGLE